LGFWLGCGPKPKTFGFGHKNLWVLGLGFGFMYKKFWVFGLG